MSVTLDICDQNDIPWEIYPGWDGPIWTGDRFIFDTSDRYGDIGMFHELAHWMMADDWQRGYPDFGLGKNVNAGHNWVSSRFGQTIEDYHPSCGYQSSWGNEPRVCKEDAGVQEALSTCAIGIYSFLSEQDAEKVVETLTDFSAWPWQNNAEIIRYTQPYITYSSEEMLDHLEKLRMLENA